MFRWFVLPVAFLASAISFPAMVFAERTLPHLDRVPAETLHSIRSLSRIFHNLKDFMTEAIRRDAQWWSKFFCFTTLLLLLSHLFL